MIDLDVNIYRIVASAVCLYAAALAMFRPRWILPIRYVFFVLAAITMAVILFDFGQEGLRILGSIEIAIFALMFGAFIFVYYAVMVIFALHNKWERLLVKLNTKK